ncbi:MAG: recombinase family protein [Chloroflexota bacterium]|nr:recombinase family protein [Chloroflexota bacterium]
MSTPVRAVIYTRVSSVAQEQDGTSLDTQEERCRAYAKERGWTIVALERETHTGADLFGRPRLTAVRQLLREGGADVLLAYALDRLSRKQTHVAIIADEAESAGVELAFVTEDFEKGPVSTFIRGAKAFAAELEREKIKERTMRGREQRLRNGRPLPAGRPIYGYQWRDDTHGKLDEDPRTAPVVRRIFAEAAAGRPIRSVARGLTADGIPTPTARAADWSSATVCKILHNDAYTGHLFGLRTRTDRTTGKRRNIPMPLADRIPLPAGTLPPLVDADTLAAVAGRLAANKAQATRNNQHPEATLLRGGFARCGYCGNNLAVKRDRRGTFISYRCNTANRDHHGCPAFAISASLLDTAVWAKVRATVLDRTLIQREVQKLRGQDPSQADLAALDRRLAETERRRTNLTKRLALFDDDDAAAPLVTEIAMLTKERRLHVADRAALLAERDSWQTAQTRLDDITNWCQTVAVNLDNLDYAGKRNALEAFGIEARVWAQGHAPRYEIRARIALRGDIVSTTSRCRRGVGRE